MDLESILNLILVIAGFGFLIAIHEAGHFLAAKRAGIQCPVFSVGFPLPKFTRIPDRFRNIFAFTWRGTEYRLGWIPFGGFVQMKGQSDTPTGLDDNDQATDDFRNVSYGNKVLVISGGVLMNAITAIIFFILAFSVFGVTFPEPVVGEVVAFDARTNEPTKVWLDGEIREGDRILSVNDRPVYDFEDAAYAAFFSDDTVRMKLERKDGTQYETDVPLNYVIARIDARLPPMMAPSEVVVGSIEESLSKGVLNRRDIVTAINGVPIVRGDEIRDTLDTVKPGEAVTVTVLRDGQQMDVNYTPRVLPWASDGYFFGMEFERPIQIAAVRSGDPASAAGILAGDVVEAWRAGSGEAWQPLASSLHLRRVIRENGAAGLQLKLRRADGEVEVSVSPKLATAAPDSYSIGVVFNRDADTSLISQRTLKIGDVRPDSLADQLGLKVGDVVSDIPSQPVEEESGGLLSRKSDPLGLYARLLEAQKKTMKEAAAGGTNYSDIVLTITRAGESNNVTIKPTNDNAYARPFVAFGFRSKRTAPQTFGVVESVSQGFHHTHKKGVQILQTLKGLFTGTVDITNLAGPVMIAKVSYTLADYGFGTLLFFLGVISINLAIVNILPLPVLDGGLLLITTIEKLKGGPLNERFMGYVNLAAFVLVISLMLFIVYNDILTLAST